MADVTVKQLAQVVGIPVERLLNQLQEAGLSFTDDQQTVNEEQKRILLNHLKNSSVRDTHVAPERITLRRKSTSQVTVGHDTHSGKTVHVEVRKKKVFVKRSTLVDQPETEEPIEIAVTDESVPSEAIVETSIVESTPEVVQAEPEAQEESQAEAAVVEEAPQAAEAEVAEEPAPVLSDELNAPSALEEIAEVAIKEETKTDKPVKKKHSEPTTALVKFPSIPQSTTLSHAR